MNVILDQDPQWLELLRLFSSVKQLHLAKTVAHPVAQILGGLPAEQVLGVLPTLESVFMAQRKPFGPVKEAISEFADARQLSGHPVSIRWDEELTIGSKEMAEESITDS